MSNFNITMLKYFRFFNYLSIFLFLELLYFIDDAELLISCFLNNTVKNMRILQCSIIAQYVDDFYIIELTCVTKCSVISYIYVFKCPNKFHFSVHL